MLARKKVELDSMVVSSFTLPDLVLRMVGGEVCVQCGVPLIALQEHCQAGKRKLEVLVL